MRLLIPVCALTAALAVPLAAQDNTVKSKTKIKTDEASVVSLTGCLAQGASGTFMLHGTAVGSDDNLTTKNKVKTDVDKDKTKVRTTTQTKGDDHTVATAGTMSMYMLNPSNGVSLSQYVGQRVQIAAVMVDRDHKDADVKIKDKTTVDPAHGDDATGRTKTKIEVDRGAFGQYNVVSVKPLGGACTP